MKTISIVELIIVLLLVVIMIITIFTKKTKKIPIIIVIGLMMLCLLAHVGYSYYREEPQLTLNGLSEVTLQANNPYVEEGANATYHKKDVSDKITIDGKVDTTVPGTYVITYKYIYNKDKVKEINRIIYVEDKEVPKLELRGDKEITLYTDETYKEPGYEAEDNVDHDLTKQVKIDKKKINNTQYQLIYSVTDSSGNKTSSIRTINLKERKVNNADQNSESEQTGGNSESSNNSTIGPNSGIIYLTFDDGPSLDITPKILDILKEENVKATFFILNYDKSKEYLVKREANEGHSIGIHGYSHDYQEIYQSVDTYMENVTKLQSKIKNTTGVTTYITRFPGGSSNTVSSFNPKIMTKLTKEVVNRGFKYYDWNVSSGDAGGAKNKDQVYNNVTKNLMRNQSNVVLMHDFSSNTKTLNALRAIIQYGKQNGYIFKAITKDTPMVTHHVNN